MSMAVEAGGVEGDDSAPRVQTLGLIHMQQIRRRRTGSWLQQVVN